MAGRGRPRKNATTSKTMLKHVEFTKMQDVKFDPSLFTPIKTGTIVDTVLSNEGGIFPGTNTVVIGDPGVGKSTVLLDLLRALVCFTIATHLACAQILKVCVQREQQWWLLAAPVASAWAWCSPHPPPFRPEFK